MEANDFKEITIYYVSGTVSIIYLVNYDDSDEYFRLLDLSVAEPFEPHVWLDYQERKDGPMCSMWLNLNNVERIVEK